MKDYYVFRMKATNAAVMEPNDFLQHCRMEVLKPVPFRLWNPKEEKNLKLALSRLYFWLITWGRYRIYFLCSGEEVAHYSYVIPKCVKFSFLEKGAFEIGPCVTLPKFRRQGCYSYMLAYIAGLPEYENAEFYMLAEASNLASIGGIEKAGFQKFGKAHKTLWKNFVVKR